MGCCDSSESKAQSVKDAIDKKAEAKPIVDRIMPKPV